MRKIFITAIISLSVLSAILLGELVVVSMANDENKRSLENVYKSSIYSLSDSLDNLQVNMSKLMVSNGTAENRELITDTYRQAETAAQSVSLLPLSFENISSTVKFFNQVGDWCVSFNNAVAEGKDASEFLAQTDEIYDTAEKLSTEFRKIEKEIGKNGVYSSVGKGRIMPSDFDGLFTDMTHTSVEYPSLIYDGPFSDGKTYCFKALERLPEITEEAALEKANALFGIENASISLTSGKVEAYAIYGKNKRGEHAFVTLAKKGGFPLLYSVNKQADEAKLSRAEAQTAATDYMDKLGIGELVPVWYNSDETTAYVNLAPKTDGVIYYTDLIKVKVALSDGTVIGFECSGYCEKNTTRHLAPSISKEQAASSVSDKIKIDSVRLAVIPKGEKEVLCYEVAGKYKGIEYFVYVDAVSGKEVNVLRVVNNEQGSLTM